MLFALYLVFIWNLMTVNSIRIGIIQHVSLSTNCSYTTINASTCDECSCKILYSSQILSLNCYSNSSHSARCELFTGTNYSSSCSYQMQNNSNAIFYFQSLPPIDQLTADVMTTVQPQNLSTIWNATGITIAGNAAGVSGANASQLYTPYSLALDSSNMLYIADDTNNRVQKWAIGGSYGTTVAGLANATLGASSVALNKPVGIVLDLNNNMYIADRNNHRVMFWVNGASSGSVYAGITGSNGTANNLLNHPTGLFLDTTNGTLYIADTYNHRIMCYLVNASSGTIVAGGNGPGTGSTQLDTPYDFTVDFVTNSLIIVNYSGHTVVRWVLGASNWTLLAGVSGASGSTSTRFTNPLSVVLDPYGNMYVSDTSNHRIQFFLAGQSNATTIAGVTGSSGTSSTHLNTPYWAILDRQLNLIVSDTTNGRIQMFMRL